MTTKILNAAEWDQFVYEFDAALDRVAHCADAAVSAEGGPAQSMTRELLRCAARRLYEIESGWCARLSVPPPVIPVENFDLYRKATAYAEASGQGVADDADLLAAARAYGAARRQAQAW